MAGAADRENAEDAEDPVTAGLARIRAEHDVPDAFPDAVLDAAARAARQVPGREHVDRLEVPFVTLDPATSTDLDQAFALERAGDDLVLRYAIADVGWFVPTGSPIEAEAWRRGLTLYLPDGKAPLYPPALGEAAASLLPGGPRPAVVFVVRVDGSGTATLDGVERALVQSRAKLAYDSVRPEDLPADFDEFARRIAVAEAARGAARVEFPEQEVERGPDGTYQLRFRPRLRSEEANAALSLAANLAVADALLAARTGLFRVMAEPDERMVRRLRNTARALDVDWPAEQSLAERERTLDSAIPAHAAFMMAIRRSGGGASYAIYAEANRPWHAAVAAPYVHATAPLRRLADRYVIETALAVTSGRPVPDDVVAALAQLPEVMDRAESRSNSIERAVVDLVEAVVLRDRVGSTFDAVVTDIDDRGARIHLVHDAVVARVSAHHVDPGDHVRVRLVEANPATRLIRFERVA